MDNWPSGTGRRKTPGGMDGKEAAPISAPRQVDERGQDRILEVETAGDMAAEGDGSPAETGQTGGEAPGTGAAGTGAAPISARDGREMDVDEMMMRYY